MIIGGVRGDWKYSNLHGLGFGGMGRCPKFFPLITKAHDYFRPCFRPREG